MNPSIVKEYKQILQSNIDVILIHDSITQVPNTDAIINPTGSQFQHSGGCSRAIVSAAGPAILNDFQNYLIRYNKLNFGDVFDTNSYKLNTFYKLILSVHSPDHEQYTKQLINHNNKQINLLELTFIKIINKAFYDLKLKSVATSLIGTGINNIPVSSCINDLLLAIQSNQQITGQILIVDNNLNALNEAVRIINSKLIPQAVITVKNDNSDDKCIICMDTIGSEPNTFKKVLDKCNHAFCNTCIDEYFKSVKKQCPVCGTVYGVSIGNQPNGTMTHTVINVHLAGFDTKSKTIQIDYRFPSGTQGANHPNPGQHYHGTSRTAYLPDTNEGRIVLKLLKRSFDLKHTFTIGTSRTTGANNVITWNDIHHKTSMSGGTASFGYPDPTYLSRVTNELAAKGIF